jgi:hypothetical protein
MEAETESIAGPRNCCEHLALFVNCMNFTSEMLQISEDKFYHEMSFDQITSITGQCVLGFSIAFNYFCRVTNHQKQPTCVLNFKRKEVMPRDRTNWVLYYGRMAFMPLRYHTVMDRVNLLAMSTNRFIG